MCKMANIKTNICGPTREKNVMLTSSCRGLSAFFVHFNEGFVHDFRDLQWHVRIEHVTEFSVSAEHACHAKLWRMPYMVC